MKLKNYIYLLTCLFLSSCFEEQEVKIFPDDQAYAAFQHESITISEAETETSNQEVPVFIAAHKGQAATVRYTISTEGLEHPAIEGVDYTLEDNARILNFPNRVGVEPIIIKPIDVAGRDRNKYLYVIITEASNNISVGNVGVDTCLVRISDNEHPLFYLTGLYRFKGTSYNPANDKEHLVEITTNEKDTQDKTVWLHNFYPGSKDFTVNVEFDTDELADLLIIEAEQSLGSLDGDYGAYINKVSIIDDEVSRLKEENVKGMVTKNEITNKVKHISFAPFCIISLNETKEDGYYNNVFRDVKLEKLEVE